MLQSYEETSVGYKYIMSISKQVKGSRSPMLFLCDSLREGK